MLRIEIGDEHVGDPCACCGFPRKSVSGYVYRNDDAHAAYIVRWTPGRPADGAAFDLILGSWGDGTGPADRRVVSLRLELGEAGPGFKVIDAKAGKESLAARALRRDEVVGTADADVAFAVVDLIWLDDSRLSELTS